MQVPVCVFLLLNSNVWYPETNNLDLGLNIADDLEQLRSNLTKFKNIGDEIET